MANPVIFRRGTSSEITTFVSQDADSLLFVEDQHIIYKTTGANKPLARYSDVQSGFVDLDDLKAKVTSPVHGKLYLLNTNHIYYYSDNEWKSIKAEAELDSFEASKVKYNNTVSTLGSNTVQSAIDELDVKVADIDDALDTFEEDLDKVIADVAILDANSGKVKLKSTDTADYIESKLDGTTVVVKNNKIKVKGIDGMTVGTTELNHLSGITENIAVKLNNLTQLISDSSSGLSYIGKFATKADLDNYANPINGMLSVVLDDGNGSTELHIYSETITSWESIGAFEFSDSFSGLKDTPSTYEADMFLKSDGSQIVYSKVKYSELQGKPSSAVSRIDQAVTDSHSHVNATILDKFTEDTSGNVLYDNQKLASESTWTTFEF